MKGLIQRLFSGPAAVRQSPNAGETLPLEIKNYNHGLVRIPALDYFGPHAASPDGAFHLIWLDRNPEGTVGGHRYEGHGSWKLLRSDGSELAAGRLERPQDGRVANNGRFILCDWMFGDGLNGRFLAFAPDGTPIIEREFSANIASSGLSDDGRIAICQTANAPRSSDSCRYFIFDLDSGAEIASWPLETAWADTYQFDLANRQVALIAGQQELASYAFDGTMVDRPAWERRNIARGDLAVIQSVIEAAADTSPPPLYAELMAGLDAAAADGQGWQLAKVFRLRGELYEQAGQTEAAIEAYDKALGIDPQVGVSRRLAKLRQAKMWTGVQKGPR